MFKTNSKAFVANGLLIIDTFSEQVRILLIFKSITNYAKEKVRLRKKGIMISDFDLLIGSTSIANDLIMITEMVKEFERISQSQFIFGEVRA